MPLLKEKKQQILERFQRKLKDTGSSPVQIALLTERIQSLSSHLKTHRKDRATQPALLKLVGQRSRLLGYLRKHSQEEYAKLIEQLQLRK
ncbi:MAG: 30S ribosomal protein S15 [Elusimicrobia bacterium]|nr:30S ribosomal protein S15 [Elusimicrobiota bacterium]